MITLGERVQNREALRRLADLHDQTEHALKTGEALPGLISMILGQLSGTDELDGQRRAVESLLEDTREAYMERLREAASTHFSCFVEWMNPDEPPARHHELMCDNLEAIEQRELMRLIISMPPGHAKSTYCSHFFPPWFIGKNPQKKYIQAGHSQDFVEKEFGLRTRNIVDTPEYRQVFPDIKLSTDSKAAGNWSIAGKLGRYLTRGVGQGISGFRAHIAAVDDPYASRADAESPAKRKEVFDWFMADFTTRLLPKSPMFIVATRWHPLDICGVLEQMTLEHVGMPWKIINLSAICEGSNDPLGREHGEALWPSFYTIDHLLNLRATLPSRDWNSLYMGKPVDENGGTVKSSWFSRYTSLPRNETDDQGNITKLNVKRIVLSVDCAQKDNQRADYTVVTVWIEDLFRRHYLAHVLRRRVEFDDMIKMIEGVATNWRANVILVEDKGSGTQYIQVRGKPALAPAPVVAISTSNESKAFRFDGVTPMFEAGEVFLPERAGWLPDYERELLQFPGSAHDDQVDSTSQYLNWARGSRQGGTRKLHGMAAAGSCEAPVEEAQRGRVRRGGYGPLVATPSAKIGG
jgi:predicted phage terminase large subunit-like protein